MKQTIKERYPITKQYGYFISNIRGAILDTALQATQQYLTEVALAGAQILDRSFSLVEETRRNLAIYLNVNPITIAFTKCTTDGINLIAQSLQFTAEDEIILTDQEFPANILPWQQTPAKIKVIKSQQGKITIDQFIAASTKKTKLIATSSTIFELGLSLILKI